MRGVAAAGLEAVKFHDILYTMFRHIPYTLVSGLLHPSEWIQRFRELFLRCQAVRGDVFSRSMSFDILMLEASTLAGRTLSFDSVAWWSLQSSGADPSALAELCCSFWTDSVLGPQDGTSWGQGAGRDRDDFRF